jgi:8-oxo-dGTP diphosphatase
METLRTITDDDFNLQRNYPKEFKNRESARAVVFNKNYEVVVLYSSKYAYHKLPGGGVEEGEEIHTTLEREMLEEIGCSINVINELGKIIEYRDEHELKHVSFCFLGKLLEFKQDPEHTLDELEHEFEIKWVKLDEAISLFEKDNPSIYAGKFMVLRDKTFLEKAKEILKTNSKFPNSLKK